MPLNIDKKIEDNESTFKKTEILTKSETKELDKRAKDMVIRGLKGETL
jgi:hypothetical protein